MRATPSQTIMNLLTHDFWTVCTASRLGTRARKVSTTTYDKSNHGYSGNRVASTASITLRDVMIDILKETI